jgi:hypothetical protein
MERTATSMKLHGLYKSERRLDSMYPFVHGEVYSNSQLDDIGAYLMKDNNRGIMIRAPASTTLSFSKRRGDIEVGGGHDL